MDAKKFIIEEFGLPEDVSFNKCPKITYFDIYELLNKFEKTCLSEMNLVCPFCNDNDFDKSGLKYHLENYCDIYTQTE